MKCPFCGAADTQVKDSRQTYDAKAVKRRRYCNDCGSRFITLEQIELQELVVVKKDGSKRPFERSKLLKSILIATRKRSLPVESIELMIDQIIHKIEKSGDLEVSTRVIGEMVMESLAKLDEVAYVRFASVYKDFTQARDFQEFLKNNIK